MKNKLDKILRVDHAGEVGAAKIYEGQLKVLGKTDVGPMIQHMKDQEKEHLDTFHDLLNEHEVRPTIMLPIWNLAGYGLGVISAAMGKKAAMACTIAVEEVIGTHYDRQVQDLSNRHEEPELVKTLARFRDEELEHRDIAVEHDGRQAPAYGLMKAIIQTGCKTAIKIAEKI